MTSRASRSWWNSPVITGSSAVASVLSLVLFPVLTRLYDPTAVGGYGLFIAATSVLGSVVTWRFDLAALAQAHDADGDREAVRLCRLSLVVALGGAVLIGIVTVALVAAGLLRVEMLWLAPAALGTAAAGLQVTMDSRDRRYGWVAAMAVARVVLFVGAAAVLASVSRSASSLCIAAVIATVPPAIRVVFSVPLIGHEAGYRSLMWTYRDYAAFQTPAAALNAAPMLVLSAWVDRQAGAAVLGLVVAASRIQMAPVNALSSSVASVVTTDVVAQRNEPGEVRRLYLTALRNSVGVTAISGIACIALAPLLELLLGPQWTGLRPYLIAVFPLAVAFMVAGVPTAVLGVIGQQRRVLTSRILLLTSLVVGFVVAGIAVQPGAMMVALGTSVFFVVSCVFAVRTYRDLGVYLDTTSIQVSNES